MKQVTKTGAVLGGLCASALLFGCASADRGAVSLVLEDLGSEVSQTHGVNGETYRSSVNVAGLTPYQPLGLVASVPGRDVPDMFSVVLNTECSKVLIQDFPSGTVNDNELRQAVLTLRDQAETLRLALAAELAARIKLELFKAERSRLDSADADQQAQIRTRLAAVFGIRTDATSSELDRSAVTLASAVDAAAMVAQKEKQIVAKASSVPSVIMTRWNVERHDGLSGGVGSFLNLSRSRSTKRSGIAVVGGLRTASLWLGDDVLVGRDRLGYGSGIDAALNARYVVTHSLSARHIAYIEEHSIETIIGAKLGLTVSQITQLFGGVLPAELQTAMINLEGDWLRYTQLGEKGLLSTPARRLFEYRFGTDRVREASARVQASRMEGYSTFYTVRSDLAHVVVGTSARNTGNCSQSEAVSSRVPETGRVVWQACSQSASSPRCVSLTEDLLAAIEK